MATETQTPSAAAALHERLLQQRTEAELAAGFTDPLARCDEGAPPLYAWTATAYHAPAIQTCSRGCHALPSSARFDPHTGEPLGRAVARPARRARTLVPRVV